MMNSNLQNRLSASERAARIGAESDRWLAEILDGPLSPDDARAFNAWLAADPEHERQFRYGQAAMREARLMKGEHDLRELMRPTFYQRLNEILYEGGLWFREQFSARAAQIAFGAAAVAAAGLCALVTIRSSPLRELPEVATSAPPAKPDHATGVAEIRDVRLPDGSIVTLGAASGLDLRFTAEERRIVLIEGEAFFEVEHDPDRPFIVAAGNMMVRVLGTKFDVNLGSEAVGISVLQGRVEVIRPEDGGAVIQERDIKHVLTAGQKVEAAKQGGVRPVETIAPDNVASWRRGELIWIDTPVRDIIADLNRYSERRITLADDSLADLDYTLAVQADDVPRGVRLLASALGLEAKEGADGDIALQ